jgi:REP element-mobilizing transposase RayT
MRKKNPVRYSSAVGEAWMHCEFKVKYCHTIFDDEIYREAMRTLILEAAYEAEIPVGEMGFDKDHVHFLSDIGLYGRSEVAKLLKGPTAKKFFEYFPELKLPKNEGGKFWDSGFWNPSYYIGSPKSLEKTINYIKGQKYGSKGLGKDQKTLVGFVS